MDTRHSDARRQWIFFSFLLVDFFVAIESTALLVAAPRVVEYFSLAGVFLPWVLNAYFFATFAGLTVLFILEKTISRSVSDKRFFIEGLIYFTLGSLMAFLSGSAEMFIFGRVIQGLGAAMVFVGQLWAMTESYPDEIEHPLFWTDLGFILGIISGPFIGGMLSGASAEGWRLIFALNVVICLFCIVLFGSFYKSRKKTPPVLIVRAEPVRLAHSFFLAILLEITVTAVAVAGEFVISTYLQEFMDSTPMATGIVLLSASVGVIVGSGFFVLSHKRNFHLKITNGIWGMTAATVLLGVALQSSASAAFLVAALFLSGYSFGFLGIAVFSYVSRILTAETLVKGTILYLIAMQLGNAFGIQMETLWSLAGRNFVAFTLFLVMLLQGALYASLRLKSLNTSPDESSQEGPLAPREWRPSILIEQAVNGIQLIIYLVFIAPLRYIFGIRVAGQEHIHVSKPYVIISNHQSLWDAFVMLSAFGPVNFLEAYPMRSPIARNMYHLPWIWVFSKLVGLYKIESRGDLDKSLETTYRQIDKEHSVVFYPEGRVARHGQMGEPKKGIAWVANRKDVSIQPVRIFYGSYDIHGRGIPWGARIVFGKRFTSQAIRQAIAPEQLPVAIMQKVWDIEDIPAVAKAARKSSFTLKTRVVHGFGEAVLDNVLMVQERSFHGGYADMHEYYRRLLGKESTIVIMLEHEGRGVGHIILHPHDDAYEELHADDPEFSRDPGRYYVETMAILPEYRRSYGYLDLAYATIREAKRRGISRFSMHIRKTKGLSNSFQGVFKKEITLIRPIAHWKWMDDEPYDYMEVTWERSLAAARTLIGIYKTYSTLRRRFVKLARRLSPVV